jgi:MSHA biogenesis protein MshI
VVAGLRKKHKLDRGHCSFLLGQQDYSLLLVEAPQVPPEEVRSAIRWKIQDLLDYHVDDAVLDVFDLPAQQGGSRPAMMYVVVAKTNHLKTSTDLMHDCGVSLKYVDVEELAYRNLASELPESAAGVALLRMDRTRGLITLCKQQQLYLARRLDLGHDVLSTAQPPLSCEQPAVSAWVDRLLVEVQRSLDYFESNFREPPIDNLVVVPPPIPLVGLEDEMAARSGLQVRCLDVEQLLEADAQFSPQLRLQCLPAIGAALRYEALRL